MHSALSDNRLTMESQSPKRPRASAKSEGRAKILSAMPPLDECLRAASSLPSLAGFGPGYLKLMVRRAQAELREALVARQSARAGAPDSSGGAETDLLVTRAAMLAAIARAAERAVAADRPNLEPVINASGVVLHTNLGRAILAESAIEAVERAARSAVNLEYDLGGGARGDRDAIVEEELRVLTGAEAATVVNNNAAAVLLALNALAEGREVIVSRGELIEIGGSFRLPDVMAKSGARLREVGTTNRTHRSDYSDAIGPDTALLLKVHPSNYRVVGFTSEVTLAELVAIGRERGIDVMVDLGAGALTDLGAYGLPREPIVAEQIAAGAALVTFSGDKLLGGPQAGVMVGRSELVAKIKANPLKRALRCDKLTLAALEATLRLYLRSGDLGEELPTLRMLRHTPAELRIVAARVRDILSERLGGVGAASGARFQIEIVESTSQIGSGALPTEELKTVAVTVTHPEISPDTIAAMFRRARVIGRITNDVFQLDMRTVEDPGVFALEFVLPTR